MIPGNIHARDDAAGGAHLVNACQTARELLSRIGDKWSVLIVMTLRGGPMRFNEIKRVLGTISQRMLTLTLRSMERDGLVTRTVTPTTPPRVDYALTELGVSLSQPVEVLGQWAVEHQSEIRKAQARYDRRHPSE